MSKTSNGKAGRLLPAAHGSATCQLCGTPLIRAVESGFCAHCADLLPKYIWADYDPNATPSKRWAFYTCKADQRGNRPDLKPIRLIVSPNDQAQRPPPETPGRLQQSRTNYPNRPPAQRGGGSLQRRG